MQDAIKTDIFPKSVLLGAAALLVFTILVAGTARITHSGHISMGPATAVSSRDLAFADRRDGGVDVTDTGTGQLVTVIEPKTGGFLRGILRGLVREHRQNDRAAGTAFHLTRWSDGRLTIADPATNTSFELEAFGSTNEAVFAKFLQARTFASEAAPATGADGR